MQIPKSEKKKYCPPPLPNPGDAPAPSVKCDQNEIGDKFHYPFICPVFQEDRNRLLEKYYRKFPSMYKFIELINVHN